MGVLCERKTILTRAFSKQCKKNVPEEGTLLLVLFATEGEEKRKEHEAELIALFKKATGKAIHYVTATEADFQKQIVGADAVYLHGGNTKQLQKTLTKLHFKPEQLADKTVAGSSAGAYLLARYRASHTEPLIREGLGFLNLRVICHFESPELPSNTESVAMLTYSHSDLPLIKLKDFEWQEIVV